MNCQEATERMLDLVIRDPERVEMLASSGADELLTVHLERCEACQQQFNELSEGWALVALSAEPKRPSDALAERILNRIHGEDSSSGDRGVVQPRMVVRGWGRQLASYSIAAGILALLIGGQLLYLKRDAAVAIASRDPSEAERLSSLEEAVAQLERLQQETDGSDIQFVSFRESPTAPAGLTSAVRAHAIWSNLSQQLHFFGFDLAPLGDGQMYAVWFTSDDQATLVAEFLPDNTGRASLVVDAPVGLTSTRVVVSVETHPVGDSPSEQIWCSADLVGIVHSSP